MGERGREAFRAGFDRSVKIVFRGSPVTSDAGPLAFRELDGALRLKRTGCQFFADIPAGRNTRRTLLAQLRQFVDSRLAG